MATVGALALAGCGGGTRQDADEPEGNFEVGVVHASFPGQQRLAKSSDLVIKVRNTGSKTVPDIAVTVDGFNYRKAADGTQLSDPERPRFAVNGIPREIGGFPEAKDATPKGCDTAYVNTWACGPLKPGAEHTFKWSVTAVKAGPYKLTWRVAGGLDGNAKAVAKGGGEVGGTFAGTISAKPPHTRIADDGKTIIVDPG